MMYVTTLMLELPLFLPSSISVGRLARGLTERFGPPNREEEEQLTDEEEEVTHTSKSTSDVSQSSTSSDATSSSESSDSSTSSSRPPSPQPSLRLLIDIRLSPHQIGHIKANRPSALYDAYVNEEVLAYGPRHRLVIEEDPELEAEVEEEEEREGPLFPKKLPAGMWGEAREWWGECAGRSVEETKG